MTWQGYGTHAVTKTGCDDGTIDTDGMFVRPCSVTTTTAPILNSGSVSETIKRDATPPVVSYTGARTYTVDETVSVHCAATDPSPGSGLASTTCSDVSGPAYTFALGGHTLRATAQDVAGNVGSGSATFTVVVTFRSLEALVSRFSTNADVASGLNDKLEAAAKAKTAATRARQLNAFEAQVKAQTGKAFTAAQADILLGLAEALPRRHRTAWRRNHATQKVVGVVRSAPPR